MTDTISRTHAQPRTHTCGELQLEHSGQSVLLKGWVHKRRDLGGLIFIDLRDRYGFTQCVVNPEDAEAFTVAESIRSEYVLAILGTVQARPEGSDNSAITTGQIEVQVHTIDILNKSKAPTIPITSNESVDEQVRLQYRYLDLRRPSMTQGLVVRHKLAKACRDFLDTQNFLEIETPMLVRSTPEGARDYIVPSRVHKGSVYALPQSPQLFKQLLMVSGMDRYFQIARCFRDEDLRADRQPEFTQIDMEMSFATREEVLELVEHMLNTMFKTVLGVDLPAHFRRKSYAEVMEHYGSDKPDLRYDLILQDVSDKCQGTAFGVFQNILNSGGCIKAMVVPGQANISRKIQSQWDAWAKELGLAGLFFLAKSEDGELKSSLAKHFPDGQLESLADAMELAAGDIALLSAAQERKQLNQCLGKLRVHLAKELKLIDKKRFEFLWVLDFPLFSIDEDTGLLAPEHHAFTSVRPEDKELLESNPLAARADSYDLVLNGYEMASGSVRIHNKELQEKILSCIGLSLEEAHQKFGFLLKAFEYGAPPHAGIALGFDRLTAVCLGHDSIRDVIAFPKNANAFCPLTDAPVQPEQEQMDVLGLQPKKA